MQASKRTLAALPRLTAAFKERAIHEEEATRDKAGRYVDLFVKLAEVSPEMKRRLLDGTDFVEHVATALTRPQRPALYAQCSSVVAVPGLSQAAVIFSGMVTGLVHAALSTPVSCTAHLATIVGNLMHLARGQCERGQEGSTSDATNAMQQAGAQPAALQKAGELVRFAEARQATAALERQTLQPPLPPVDPGRSEFEEAESRLLYNLLRLAMLMTEAATSASAGGAAGKLVCPTTHIGSRSLAWVRSEVDKLEPGDPSRQQLEDALQLIEKLQEQHRRLARKPPTALESIAKSVSAWSWAWGAVRAQAGAAEGAKDAAVASPSAEDAVQASGRVDGATDGPPLTESAADEGTSFVKLPPIIVLSPKAGTESGDLIGAAR